MHRLCFLALLGAALSGCDALFDPNVARIDGATLAEALAGDGAVFVRLATPFDTTDTEAASGPFPLRLATAGEILVSTSDGPFDGDPLAIEVRQCVDTCETSVVLGRRTLPPGPWPASERTVSVDGASVTLHYRRTSS